MKGMKQHRERMLAEKQVRQSQPQDPWQRSGQYRSAIKQVPQTDSQQHVPEAASAQDNPAQAIELRLYAQLKELEGIKSMETRAEKKAQWLPDYQGYIDGCLAVSPAPQNNVLLILMVWALDSQQLELASRIGRYAVLNDMVMPEPWTRSVAEVVTEQAAEVYNNNVELATAQHLVIQDIIDLGRGEDMLDLIRAKIYKAQGLALRQQQPQEAIQAFKTALRLDGNSGVKKLLESTERAIKSGTPGSTLDAGGPQEGTAMESPATAPIPATTAPDPAQPGTGD